MTRQGIGRWGTLLVSLLLISGCAVQFVYNRLDWLVPWYLEDYIELEGPQRTLFKTRLDAYLQWHRQQQLPQYATFLRQVADQAETGLSGADIADIQLRTEQFAQAMVTRLQPDMMDLFALASDQQVEALVSKFATDNAEYRRDYIDVSARKQRKQRQREVIRYVERWTGDLNDSQRKLIDDWSERFELMGEDIAATRLAWQQEFHRILLLRADRAAYESAFSALLDSPGFARSDTFQRKLDHNQQLLIGLYLALEQSLTPAQRTRMVKKMRSYADDFHELAQQK